MRTTLKEVRPGIGDDARLLPGVEQPYTDAMRSMAQQNGGRISVGNLRAVEIKAGASGVGGLGDLVLVVQ